MRARISADGACRSFSLEARPSDSTPASAARTFRRWSTVHRPDKAAAPWNRWRLHCPSPRSTPLPLRAPPRPGPRGPRSSQGLLPLPGRALLTRAPCRRGQSVLGRGVRDDHHRYCDHKPLTAALVAHTPVQGHHSMPPSVYRAHPKVRIPSRVVRLAGIEPATSCSAGKRSIR